MIASIFNWQVLYWVDYSSKWAELIEVSENDFAEISAWRATIDVVSWEVIEVEETPKTDEELTEVKRQEMQSLIDTHYPLETRLQYMTKGILDDTDNDFVDMNEYMNWINAEFTSNGKDADFTERK